MPTLMPSRSCLARSARCASTASALTSPTRLAWSSGVPALSNDASVSMPSLAISSMTYCLFSSRWVFAIALDGALERLLLVREGVEQVRARPRSTTRTASRACARHRASRNATSTGRETVTASPAAIEAGSASIFSSSSSVPTSSVGPEPCWPPCGALLGGAPPSPCAGEHRAGDRLVAPTSRAIVAARTCGGAPASRSSAPRGSPATTACEDTFAGAEASPAAPGACSTGAAAMSGSPVGSMCST